MKNLFFSLLCLCFGLFIAHCSEQPHLTQLPSTSVGTQWPKLQPPTTESSLPQHSLPPSPINSTLDPTNRISTTGTTLPTQPGVIRMLQGKAAVEAVDVVVLDSVPPRARVIVNGYLPDSCTIIDKVDQTQKNDTFIITITTKRPVDAVCMTAIVPFEQTVILGQRGLSPGTYIVVVNEKKAVFTLNR